LPFHDAPQAVTPLDVPIVSAAAQDHGWRFAIVMPAARSGARRAWSVAATGGVRMGMRGWRKGVVFRDVDGRPLHGDADAQLARRSHGCAGG
jgi:hypothetical protein